MSVPIQRHHDRRMPEPRLHRLRRKLESSPAPVDAPRRIEMPQRMQPRILRLAIRVDDAGLHLQWDPGALHDVVERDWPTLAGPEHEIARRTRELPAAQRIRDH